MTKQEAIAIAKDYFKSHPKTEEFFVTKDGQVFFSEQAAANHATSFPKDEREVVNVSKDETLKAKAEKVEESEPGTADGSEEKQTKGKGKK